MLFYYSLIETSQLVFEYIFFHMWINICIHNRFNSFFSSKNKNEKNKESHTQSILSSIRNEFGLYTASLLYRVCFRALSLARSLARLWNSVRFTFGREHVYYSELCMYVYIHTYCERCMECHTYICVYLYRIMQLYLPQCFVDVRRSDDVYF